MRSCGGCVGVDAPEGAGAPLNAPQDTAKVCADQFNPDSDEQPGHA
jgi:hypothetical protein